ncbi:MAG: argininosuccinate lyase [Candidatus Omnitrophica bacterium]|nr:argininosuccinate lyase [Candidatus Omnitrophota bacterium]
MSKLWGGRFKKPTNKFVEVFGRSIQFDYKLARYDCFGSLAHIQILKDAGLLLPAEYDALAKGLKVIIQEIENDQFIPDFSFEDIHSYIQSRLEKDLEKEGFGEAALKLHTCRSRNDQVVFDTKLYCLINIEETASILSVLRDHLLDLAKKTAEQQIFIPGYTHLQHAIPVALGEYFHAYYEMLTRDHKRLMNAIGNIELTLGSGALAGTFINSQKYNQNAVKFVAELKSKIITPPSNSLDAVSDRDFVIEILSALAILGMHLSRLSEDMILWASKEFDFIDIDDAFCTGSSLMPQKKNPDVFELVRGQTGRLYGNLMNVLVVMKGLPLAYNRDMQHDKEPLFDSFKVIQQSLRVLAELLTNKNISFKTKNIENQLKDESLYATDIADYLVKNQVPFKKAHEIVGKLIALKYSGKEEEQLRDLDDSVLKEYHPLLNSKIIKQIINPRTSVESKESVKRIKR